MTAPGVTAPIATLRLFDGETVLAQGRAQPQLFWSQALASTIALTIGLVTLPFAPLAWWAARQGVAQHRWWLTDRRLIVANGVIGRTVRSVPLDRVVDVTVKSTWWDRMFGLEHVTVRDMTGESTDGVSRGLVLLAVDDADAIADRILTALPQRHTDADLVDALRRLVAA